MSRRTILFIRWGVFLLACGFLYVRLARQGDTAGLLTLIQDLDPAYVCGTLALVSVMMLVNWWVESWKWRLLVRDIEPVSAGKAFLATLAGTSIGMITPNRVGEFVGRVLFLAPAHRIPAGFATAVGSIAQFVVTVCMGILSLIAMHLTTRSGAVDPFSIAGGVLCAIVALGSLWLYFDPQLLCLVIARIPFVRRWQAQAEVLVGFRTRRLLGVLLLGLLRYVVFTLQFAILLTMLVDMPFTDSLFAIPAVFLVSTLIPTVMLTELGVRGSVAVAILSSQAQHDEGVLLASMALWLINVGVPALAGSFILLLTRIRSTPAT